MIQLTDHELRFAESPDGRRRIAQARAHHDVREAHKGSGARPWTDAMEAEAARSAAAQSARSTVARTANDAIADRETPIARAARDTALAVAKERARNAWRGDR